jgi:hypothetical protein
VSSDEHYNIFGQRCVNYVPTQSGVIKFADLPSEAGAITKLEERGDYLWVESESGKTYRIDSSGEEVIQSNLRIIPISDSKDTQS